VTTEQICQAYGIEVFDYTGNRKGILVAGGTGLMLAIMDVVPIRYCIDGDSLNEKSDAISSAILLLARYAPPVFVAGWYTSKSPENMRAGVALAERHGLASNVLCYVGGDTGYLAKAQHTSLATYLDAARAQIGSP
jgi:hypothetical protein